MKKSILTITTFLVLISCSSGFISCADKKNQTSTNTNQFRGSFGQSVIITDDGSTTNYVDTTTASATGYVKDDLYENFEADGTVYITLNGTSASVTKTDGSISESDIKISNTENSAEDEAAKGLEIQYKGKLKLKYVLSGAYTGTVFIKK